MDKQKPGDYRVWWRTQSLTPVEFFFPVTTITDAKLVLKALADYDSFLTEIESREDGCNVGGLEILSEDGGWEEYETEEGDDIFDLMEEGEWA